jgi:dTDP-4-dehydrorhamnose 3,5-epimerase
MKIEQSKILPEVTILTPDVFHDFRGKYVETYNEKEYSILTDYNNESLKFVQDDISMSQQHVLRGLHGDFKTWKLIQCLYGSIFVAAVDMRPDSPNYLKHDTFSVSEHDRRQVLIPSGFANGHLCLSDKCIFSYKQTTYYEGQGKQFTVRYDDPSVGITWPVKDVILSKRDSTATLLGG